MTVSNKINSSDTLSLTCGQQTHHQDLKRANRDKKVQKQSTMTQVYLRLEKYEVRKQCQTFHNGLGDFMKSYVRCSIWHFRFVLLNLKVAFHQKIHIRVFVTSSKYKTKSLLFANFSSYNEKLNSDLVCSNQYVEDLTKTLILPARRSPLTFQKFGIPCEINQEQNANATS